MAPQDDWAEMLEAIKKDHDNQRGNSLYWTPPRDKEGTFPIRILPPLKKKGENRFYFQHYTHWIDGTSYECIDQELVDKNGNLHHAETCPICSFVKKLYKTAERGDEYWKTAGELSRKVRYVYRIIVRGSEDETVPKFYETGKTIFNILYHILTETDYGIIIDPINGRDFNLTKTGTGRRSRYDQSLPAANITPLFSDKEQMRLVLANAMNMDYSSLIEFSSADTMEKALRDYLGMETKPSNVEPDVSSFEKKMRTETPTQVEETSTSAGETLTPVEGDDDDDIESILAEFGQN